MISHKRLARVALAIAAALGLGAIFSKFDWMVIVPRYLVAAYLVCLGIGMILTARQSASIGSDTVEVIHKPILSILWQGVLVEPLNPKTVLFFALFLPPFALPEQGSVDEPTVTLQLLVLGWLVPPDCTTLRHLHRIHGKRSHEDPEEKPDHTGNADPYWRNLIDHHRRWPPLGGCAGLRSQEECPSKVSGGKMGPPSSHRSW